MNKHIYKRLVTFIVFFFLTFSVFAQIPDDLILCLKSGNDKILAGYFNQNIELVVPGHDDVFSKSQAQQLVAKFFKETNPVSFSILHQGTSGNDGARYAIGKLGTAKGNYRVYFLLKTSNNKAYIHQLRIEKQA
jgi:hypothetical protein